MRKKNPKSKMYLLIIISWISSLETNLTIKIPISKVKMLKNNRKIQRKLKVILDIFRSKNIEMRMGKVSKILTGVIDKTMKLKISNIETTIIK